MLGMCRVRAFAPRGWHIAIPLLGLLLAPLLTIFQLHFERARCLHLVNDDQAVRQFKKVACVLVENLEHLIRAHGLDGGLVFTLSTVLPPVSEHADAKFQSLFVRRRSQKLGQNGPDEWVSNTRAWKWFIGILLVNDSTSVRRSLGRCRCLVVRETTVVCQGKGKGVQFLDCFGLKDLGVQATEVRPCTKGTLLQDRKKVNDENGQTDTSNDHGGGRAAEQKQTKNVLSHSQKLLFDV